MENVWMWVLLNWDTMLEAAFMILSGVSLIVKLTPSPKDDEFVKRLFHWLSFLKPRGEGMLKLPFRS